ncbi:MAG: glutamine amidotransferase [Alphaproteobacteria bacterium]
MKRFLILQVRPETDVCDDEFEAIIDKAGLAREATHRVRLDQLTAPPEFVLDDYAGVIVGGGPGCVSDTDDEKSAVEKRMEDAVLGLMPAITERDFPFLGCCYGIGILAHHLGAPVSKDAHGEEVGAVTCQVTEDGARDPLLAGLPATFRAFVGHKEAVQALPPGCVYLLASPTCPYQMIRFGQHVYATQFHPEADGDVFEMRIRRYRNDGYFAPGDADRLIAMCQAEDVRMPAAILRNFVATYR